MQDLRTKRHVVISPHLQLVFIYTLVYILSRILSGISPGIYTNYYKISLYLNKEFYVLISRS